MAKIPALRRAGIALLLSLATAIVALYVWMPGWVMRHYNRTLNPGPYTASSQAQTLHQSLFIGDLHCDALMWPRRLTERGTTGHVDVPRLIEANVAVECFYAVNRVPWGQKMDGNGPGWDALAAYNFFQGWPVATWYSPKARALHMAGLLDKAAQRSNGALAFLRTRKDLDRYVERRKKDSKTTAAILGAEGLYCIEDQLENIRVLYNAGYRALGFTHFHDNTLAGSAQGLAKGGLTDFGKQALRFIERLKMIPDLAHLSERAIDDVLAAATRPVLVSHTGLRGISDRPRNLDDAQARRIAERGGIIGIGFWDEAVGAPDVPHIVKSIRYAADLLGADHVALGSDFDGSIAAPFDVTGLPLLTEGLLDAGFSPKEIAAIMGGNIQRFLLENLPLESDTASPEAN